MVLIAVHGAAEQGSPSRHPADHPLRDADHGAPGEDGAPVVGRFARSNFRMAWLYHAMVTMESGIASPCGSRAPPCKAAA